MEITCAKRTTTVGVQHFFTFIHLADAVVQTDLQCDIALYYTFVFSMCNCGIAVAKEPENPDHKWMTLNRGVTGV